jgi:hypothetical protein
MYLPGFDGRCSGGGAWLCWQGTCIGAAQAGHVEFDGL